MNVKDARARIEAEYDVVDGLIRNPGKFELEAAWVPYYWGLFLEGEGEDLTDVFDEDGESSGPCIVRFTVDADEEEAFADLLDGELACGSTIELMEDSQGFVIGTVMDAGIN